MFLVVLNYAFIFIFKISNLLTHSAFVSSSHIFKNQDTKRDQRWHDKDPSLLRPWASCIRSKTGDVFIWVKSSRMGRKTNKQTRCNLIKIKSVMLGTSQDGERWFYENIITLILWWYIHVKEYFSVFIFRLMYH